MSLLPNLVRIKDPLTKLGALVRKTEALPPPCRFRIFETKNYDVAENSGKPATDSGSESSGWIVWAGGECPVDKDVIVVCKFRCGVESKRQGRTAQQWRWAHVDSPYDIVAYMVLSPVNTPKADAEGWIEHDGKSIPVVDGVKFEVL